MGGGSGEKCGSRKVCGNVRGVPLHLLCWSRQFGLCNRCGLISAFCGRWQMARGCVFLKVPLRNRKELWDTWQRNARHHPGLGRVAVMIGSVCICYCTFIFFFFFLFPSIWLQTHAWYAWTISHIDSYMCTDHLYAHRPLVYNINTCNLGCVFFSLFLLVFPQYYCFLFTRSILSQS